MKKYIVLGVLALSAASFAKGNGMGNNGHDGKMNSKRNNKGAMVCPVDGTTMRRDGKMALTHEQQKLRTQSSIAIQEKQLAVRKEMAKDNVNWTNIEKLNREMANLRADQQTQMMKFRVENAAKATAPASN